MPSGKKKRLRERRMKQGSPAIDANSDRDTEALSLTGSVDVDDLESGLDTPVKVSPRPAFLDRETVSSQTDEWVRVSDFDVGTPTSQTEENDPSAEDGDTGSSRRSLDKLAEWETVSREQVAGRQDESITSLEEEPSECEVASAHSSDSYTHLPSPHLASRDKNGDSSDSDRKNSSTNRSGSSSSSNSSTDEKRAPVSAETFDLPSSEDIRGEVSSPQNSVPAAEDGQVEQVEGVMEDSGEEKIVGGAVPVAAIDVLSDDTNVMVADRTPMEDNPVEESSAQVQEEGPTASTESAPTATNPDQLETISANGKDIDDVGPLQSIPAAVEEASYEEEVLPVADKSRTEGRIPGDERIWTSSLTESGGEDASPVDVEDKEVKADTKIVSQIIDESAAADDKAVASTSVDAADEEVASTSADAEEEKPKGDKEVASTSADADADKPNGDAPDSEVIGKDLVDPQELIHDSLSGKAVLALATAEPVVLTEGGHHSVSTPVEKNLIEKRHIEAKSSAGCCGVIYWLLGWDH